MAEKSNSKGQSRESRDRVAIPAPLNVNQNLTIMKNLNFICGDLYEVEFILSMISTKDLSIHRTKSNVRFYGLKDKEAFILQENGVLPAFCMN